MPNYWFKDLFLAALIIYAAYAAVVLFAFWVTGQF